MSLLPKKIESAVWSSPSMGMVSLTRDWFQKSPPPLFWGNEQSPLLEVRKAPPLVFGEISGYFTQGAWLTFCMKASRYSNYDLQQSGVYVAGEFNGWDPQFGKRIWRLEPVLIGGEIYYLLNVQKQRCFKRGKTNFKFVTGEGVWIEAPAETPNVVTDKSGNQNLCFHPHRTGHHQFYFSPPHPIDHGGQSLIVWAEGDYKETALMMPGEYLLSIDSQLQQGSIVENGSTVFRLFAPRASGVTVSYFWDLDESDKTVVEASRVDTGTWEARVPGDLHGCYYYFHVRGEASDAHSAFDPAWPVLDPWALATAGPRGPAIVIDRNRVKRPEKRFNPPSWHDLVIVEAHVRDLTAYAPLSLSHRERQGFAGLAKWARHPEFYLNKLGANCVELQPIQQNDALSPDDYHWGYMTNNYFSPASQYALNPEKASQIDEFRDAVTALHEQGLAVILDVVYNHVGEPNPLQPIDKHYYFELSPDGHYMNWSGCGNTLRCSAPMVKRLIVESLTWLIEAYDVDGFRFDLAELIGVGTLKHIEQEIKKVKPSAILIAEPWSFRGHIAHELKKTGFASWNDGYREFVRKYLLGEGNCEGIQYFLAGSLGHMSAWPAQSVNYLESHDDKCWLDRITENADGNGFNPTPLDRRRSHLMCSILMMSLGIPMLSSGQDFLRSKQGHHNTYKRGDLNALDYRRMLYYSGTHEYFRSWIKFRLSDAGRLLRLESTPSPGYLQYFCAPNTSAIVALYNADNSQGSTRLLYGINPTAQTCSIDLKGLDFAAFRQVADHERVQANGLVSAKHKFSGGKLELLPYTCGLWLQE